MPASGSCIFTDGDSYQAGRREMVDLLALQPNQFRARLTWVELPGLRLVRAQETAARVAYVSLPPGRVFVSFPTRRGSLMIHDGAELKFGDIMFHKIGEASHQRTVTACHWGSISLTPASLMTFGRTIAGHDLVPPPASRTLRPTPEKRLRLLRLHAQAARMAETNLDSIGHPEVARALEQDLILALITSLIPCEARGDAVVAHDETNLSMPFEALLAARPYELLPASEISRALGISERELRTWSTRALGMSLGRYQRMRQLKLLRIALQCGDAAPAELDSLAQRHGFADLHQFITEYWRTYGELLLVPPETDAP